MHNPWLGKLAKSITAKKHPKMFWNVFFSLAIVIIFCVMLVFSFQVASDYMKYEESNKENS